MTWVQTSANDSELFGIAPPPYIKGEILESFSAVNATAGPTGRDVRADRA